jgi:Protein of unknown function (DUF3866)
VIRIAAERPGAVELEAEIEGTGPASAIAYPELTGPIDPGDEILANTTAVELGLGTGGMHVVVAVTSRQPVVADAPGRVMKARYTPLQTAVRSVEEASAAELEGMEGLGGTPVVVAPLHSMVAPVAAGARAAGAERLIYVMTDGAALPGAFSRLVPRLREAELLDGFVTSGQAFGGETEAVTTWSALLAAKALLRADVIVVADGPGNLGTETTWGVSALRSGEALNAAGVLGGRPVAAIRISFADPRERHRGISHHSRTILSRVCLVPATVAVPVLQGRERDEVWSTLRALDTAAPLEPAEADGAPALDLLRERGVAVESMGRGPDDDPAFFLAAGAAGAVAASLRSQRDR